MDNNSIDILEYEKMLSRSYREDEKERNTSNEDEQGFFSRVFGVVKLSLIFFVILSPVFLLISRNAEIHKTSNEIYKLNQEIKNLESSIKENSEAIETNSSIDDLAEFASESLDMENSDDHNIITLNYDVDIVKKPSQKFKIAEIEERYELKPNLFSNFINNASKRVFSSFMKFN